MYYFLFSSERKFLRFFENLNEYIKRSLQLTYKERCRDQAREYLGNRF